MFENIISELKELTMNKFDISVEITPEIRSVEDKVVLLNFNISEEYEIFCIPLLNACNKYISSLHLTTWYHCTRR